ncbi:MAG: single-stranded DNA-binding protein [Elusimicrobiaceae bacterium]|nr:single-stranded DNA-binding protein [Elusimicrobiaceae bacterium]
MATLRLPEQNQVLLAGRLTRDPEVRFTQKGSALCRFDIAVNRRYLDKVSNEWKDDVTFVPVVVWGAQAERCKEKLSKGSPVHVEGRLKSEEWTDKTGQKRKTMVVVSSRLQFLASGPVSEGSQAAGREIPESQINPAGDDDVSPAGELDDVPF